MEDQLVYRGTLVAVTCWCGIRHAIPAELNRTTIANNDQVVYCPLGHEWVRSESRVRELERELARERESRRAIADLLAHEERSHAATRGHLTRTKRRAAAGTCPCCNRTFRQLTVHMRRQHPDYVEAARIT